jgi:hypothetical protein
MPPPLNPITLTRSIRRWSRSAYASSADCLNEYVAVAPVEPVPAQVRRDELIPGGRLLEDVLPVRTVTHPAVQPQQRFARAVRVVMQLHAVDFEHHQIVRTG